MNYKQQQNNKTHKDFRTSAAPVFILRCEVTSVQSFMRDKDFLFQTNTLNINCGYSIDCCYVHLVKNVLSVLTNE